MNSTTRYVLIGVGLVVATVVGVVLGIVVLKLSDAPRGPDGHVCKSGKTIEWGEHPERCATSIEAEYMDVCPGGRVIQSIRGLECESLDKE